MPFAAAFLICALALLDARVRQALRRRLHQNPLALFGAAVGIAGALAAAAAYYGAFSARLSAMILAYSLAPAVCVFLAGAPSRIGGSTRASWLDLLAVALLWLPLEFAAGATLVPRPVQGSLHAAAYGASILLALVLFLLFRSVEGMKYRLPTQVADYRNAAIGFGVAAATLIPLGLWVGFLLPAHPFQHHASTAPLRLLLIFLGTALPEELLFRALIQNFLMQRLGDSNRTIALAALIFGCAHLNNGPLAAPNWRYAIVAAVAGFIFGKVFQKSGSVFAPAFVHMGVDGVKWAFF